MVKKFALLALIGFDLFLLYFVLIGQKADYMAQAQERFAKVEEFNKKAIAMRSEILRTNALLWQLALDLQDLPKDRKSVVGHIKNWQKANLPEETLGGFVQDVSTTVDGVKTNQWKVAWKRYSIVLTFDSNEMLSEVNVDDLLMQSAQADAAAVTEAETAAE